jgi:hypothetical protein
MKLVLFWLFGVPASVALLFAASSSWGPATANGLEVRIIESSELYSDAQSGLRCLEIVLIPQRRSERRVACHPTTG